MGHATIADAFNAAAGFNNQMLGYMTQEKQYQLDTIAFEQSLEMQKIETELIADYTRVDESGENIFQQNPELYQRHVQKRLAEWRKAAGDAGNNSKYYNDAIHRISLQGETSMHQRVLAVQTDVERQRVDVAFAKRLSAIDNNAEWDTQTKLAEKFAALEEYKGLNRMDTAAEYQQRGAIFNASFKQALHVDIGNMSPTEALDVLNKQIEEYEEAAKSHLAEGEELDGFLDKKRELIADAKKATVEAVQQRNLDSLEVMNREYLRVRDDARNTKDPALRRQALMMQREGAAARQRAMREAAKPNGEYNLKDREKIIGMFPMMGEASGSGSGGGSKVTVTDVKNIVKMQVDAIIKGEHTDSDGNVLTLQDLADTIVPSVWAGLTDEQKASLGPDEATQMLNLELDFYANCLDSLEPYLEEHSRDNPGFAYDIRKIKDLMPDVRGREYLDVAAVFMNDLLYSVQHDTFTPREWYDKAAKLNELLRSEKFEEGWGKKNRFNPHADDEKSVFKAAEQLLANPEVIFTVRDKENTEIKFLTPEYERQVTQYQKEERALLANKLGIDDSQLLHNWQEEEGQRDDVTGLGEYKVMDEKGNYTGSRVRLNPKTKQYEQKEDGGDWEQFTPEPKKAEKPSGAEIVSQQWDAYEERANRINVENIPRPDGVTAEDWERMNPELRTETILGYLAELINPNTKKIPPDEWDRKDAEQKREAIFAFFEGTL